MESKEKHIEGFPEMEIWELKYSIANFIAPRLKVFIKQFENGNNYTVPSFLVEDDKDENFNIAVNKWIEILKKILYPFDYMQDSNNPKFDNIEHEEKCKQGLELFAKYFENLWD